MKTGPWPSMLAKLRGKGLEASADWDPGEIANGSKESKEVTVTGAQMGDFCLVSFSQDIQDLILDAQITAANTVTCVLANNTGAAVDANTGEVYIRVIEK